MNHSAHSETWGFIWQPETKPTEIAWRENSQDVNSEGKHYKGVSVSVESEVLMNLTPFLREQSQGPTLHYRSYLSTEAQQKASGTILLSNRPPRSIKRHWNQFKEYAYWRNLVLMTRWDSVYTCANDVDNFSWTTQQLKMHSKQAVLSVVGLLCLEQQMLTGATDLTWV